MNTTQTLMIATDATAIFKVPTGEKKPVTIAVHPGNGGTVTVETMTASGGEWVPVASGGLAGDLSAPVSDVLTGTLYAVEFSASGAPATIELAW